jgi:ABC-2 type transport system permease protein
MFLGFTLLKLKSGRTSTRWYISATKYIAVIVVTLALGYVTSRPGLIGYWDTTATQSNSIHPRVQKILKDLGDEPLEVTLYTNLLGGNMNAGLPQNRNAYLSGMWEKYVRFKHNIEFKYEYYYDAKPDNYIFKNYPGKKIDEIAKDHAKSGDLNLSLFKKPAEMKQTIWSRKIITW